MKTFEEYCQDQTGLLEKDIKEIIYGLTIESVNILVEGYVKYRIRIHEESRSAQDKY